jgi:hypothetical protein
MKSGRKMACERLPRNEIVAKIRADATVNDHVKQLVEAMFNDAGGNPKREPLTGAPFSSPNASVLLR